MTDEEEDKLVQDYMQEEVALFGRNIEILNRILGAIELIKGKVFVESVKACIEESEIDGFHPAELVKEPVGEYQKEDYNGSFEGIWVQQWSVGDSGDSYQGYVCIQLKEKMYLKFRYSM